MNQERWHAIPPLYYRESHAALLIFDITNHKSFDHLKEWNTELTRFRGRDDLCVTVVAHKMDLREQREVSDAAIMKYAKSIDADVVWTSAKSEHDISNLFNQVAYNIVEKTDFCHSRYKVITLGDYGVGKSTISGLNGHGFKNVLVIQEAYVTHPSCFRNRYRKSDKGYWWNKCNDFCSWISWGVSVVCNCDNTITGIVFVGAVIAVYHLLLSIEQSRVDK